MCVQRFRLLQNIENESIETIVKYLARLTRLYAVFSVIAVLNIVSAYYTNRAEVIFEIVYAILYIGNVLMMFQMVRQPTIMMATLSIVTIVILFAYNVFYLLYQVLVEKSIWALFAVIGLVFQVTTVFILYKLRQKIVNKENTNLLANAEVNYDVEQPYVHRTSTGSGFPSAPPLAEAYVVTNSKL